MPGARQYFYAPMLLASGATVPAAFGARPMFEADLLLRVSDERINRAHSPAEVLAAVDQVIPFIELPDLLVVEPAALDGAAITAINVGARLGVMAAPIAVHANPAFLDALQSMQVIVGETALSSIAAAAPTCWPPAQRGDLAGFRPGAPGLALAG